MTITWLDILKLTVPFATAILMVWIKAIIEQGLMKKNKQHALSRLISDEVNELPNVVNALKRIAEAASNQKLRLVSIDISTLMGKLGSDLSDIDARNAYCYSDLVSSIEIVDKGLSRLSSFVEHRAASNGMEVSNQLDRAIAGQSRILASDFVSLGRSSLSVIKEIPEIHRYQDSQAVNAIKNAISNAEKDLENWPTLPVKYEDAQQSTLGQAQDASRPSKT